MRYTGPRNRIARREGIDLGLKTPGSKGHASLLKKLSILPGQHGTRSRRKFSERGKQLREKQKLRYLFGITDTALKNYFKSSMKKKGNTALFLSKYLESRLDNIVFRLGFAPTRASARQLISHGHITVNGKTVNIASCQLKVNDMITFGKAASATIPYIAATLENKSVIIPSWMERKAIAGKIIGKPTAEDIEKQIHLREIIEYYSR